MIINRMIPPIKSALPPIVHLMLAGCLSLSLLTVVAVIWGK